MNRVILLGLTLAAFAAAPAAAEFTQEEQEILDACVSNISEKVYSPDEAGKCLDALEPGSELYEKLKAEDRETLTYILKYENLFKELGEFFGDGPDACTIRQRYISLLETDAAQHGCVLCELGMGPQPEKTFNWVNKYYSDALPAARRGALAWEEACASHAATLARTTGVTQGRWVQLKLRERESVIMVEFAVAGAQEPPNGFTGCGPFQGNHTQFMKQHLPPDIHARVTEIAAKTLQPANGKTGTGADASKYAEASKNARNIAGKSDGAVLDYLGGIFDKKAAGLGQLNNGKAEGAFFGGKTQQPNGKYALSADHYGKVAEELNTRLLGGVSSMDNKVREGAIGGTKLEDELNKYYNEKGKDGKLLHPMQLKVMNLPGNYNGMYCRTGGTCGPGLPGPGEIALNSKLVENWMKKNDCTADRLMSDPAMMDKLARSVYPIAVHEGIHQVHQEDYYLRNGVPNKSMLDKEVVAFAGQAAAIKNKLSDPKTRALYEQEITASDKHILSVAEKDGYRGLTKFLRPYYDIEGAQGASSKTFSQMEAGFKELQLRKNDTGYDKTSGKTGEPCSWGNVSGCSTAKLTSMTNKAYPWYELVIKQQQADIQMLEEEFARLEQKRTRSTFQSVDSSFVAPM